ncbi:unnamed protein product [Heligmosomoides polygyrus]|uniref:ThiF domain-containing protein n=1 Tax=Heligmosomoides polygyrus TaxID=6339 RepID=A0A183F519_HELPZ|nr:unnamed protein product [Heligmosomoides polygyrus]
MYNAKPQQDAGCREDLAMNVGGGVIGMDAIVVFRKLAERNVQFYVIFSATHKSCFRCDGNINLERGHEQLVPEWAGMCSACALFCYYWLVRSYLPMLLTYATCTKLSPFKLHWRPYKKV